MMGRSTVTSGGFSLMELLVVIAIAGLLATATWSRLALMAPKYRLGGATRVVAAEAQRARGRAISEGKCGMLAIDRVAKTTKVGVATTSSPCPTVVTSYTFEGASAIDDTGTIAVESSVTPGSAPTNPIFNSRGGAEPTSGLYPSIRFYNVLGDGRLVLVNAAGRVQIQ